MNKLVTITIAAATFTLGMCVAFYMVLHSEPCKVYDIQSRYLNYSDKDCYTKSDVELIVFGKVLEYDKK